MWTGTGNWIWDAGTIWQSPDKLWHHIQKWLSSNLAQEMRFPQHQSKFNYFILVWYISWASIFLVTEEEDIASRVELKEDEVKWLVMYECAVKCSALSHLLVTEGDKGICVSQVSLWSKPILAQGGSGKCCPITSPSDKCEYVSVIFRVCDHWPDALSREQRQL